MQAILKILRYLVFAIFIICNAIIASVSVWNFSLSKAVQQELQVDTYLTVVGASGLLFVFLCIFLELAGKNSILGRVWFECAWVGVYWMLELAGAAALSAIGPKVLCGVELFVADGCSSTQVLLAFCWICTITLMGYFLLLLVTSILYQKQDPTIWQCEVQQFPWSNPRCLLASTPPSPSFPKSQNEAKRPSAIVAPKPRRVAPPELYAYRSGLSPEYEIEHYRPPSTFAQPVRPEPVAFPTRTQMASIQQSPAAFYPQYMQSALNAQLPQMQTQPQETRRSSTPPPLGSWPRADIMSQPTRTRSSRAALPAAQSATGTSPTSPSSFSRSSRPTGPRRQSNSGSDHRPPALNLSSISSHRQGPSP
ncbi:hypothetical protein BDN72DRAFT_755999 [Pluteus cervinus]|uniref:Uncharacterized protein n=1 Tax=Pluteus cervinus TaxID=181527 RepID=A0ACD3BFM3_9AGAR|nr:hypothetical protein BDN72DRAFT_755999 [Pluteus cervinus]